MYTQGIVAGILVILLVSASGCSFLSPAPKSTVKQGTPGENTPLETPTLPDQYVAHPVTTPTNGLAGVTTQALQANQSPPLISPAQMMIITGTNLSGNETNSSTTNGTVSIPVAQFTSNVVMGFAPLTVQ